MKKMISVVLAGCLAMSLAACGSSDSSSTAASSTASSAASSEASSAASSEASSEAASGDTSAESVKLTGEAQGYGGTITATVTMSGDTITDVTFDGPDETPEVGGAALDELADQIVKANGTDIDGKSGASLTTQGCKDAVQAALDSASSQG